MLSCRRLHFQTFLFLLVIPRHVASATCATTNCVTKDGEEVCTFTSEVKIHAGELGYYSFKECGDDHNPTLEMKIGTTYVFEQSEKSNHMHPLGFAYYPGGAHNDLDELEPTKKPKNSTSKCHENMSCPAPMYMINDKYQGKYSNNALYAIVTADEEDFGLDVIEPLFYHPLLQWHENKWSVAVKYDIDDIDQDIFYFCHIHQYMSGRIKLISADGKKVAEVDTPNLGFEYDQPSDFDKKCGTHNTIDYKLPNSMCPERFVCDTDDASAGLKQFSECIEAMDCAMVHGMTNHVKSNSEIALFIHQMIPHHQNAVNMAKALLKSEALKCADIKDEENSHCIMEEVARSMINTQNFQIQQMRGVLEAESYKTEEEESCQLESSGVSGVTGLSATVFILGVVVAFVNV